MPKTSLAELLNLTASPVAIAFVDTAPPGVPHVGAAEPAGCGYWRRATSGEVFYTVADDHKSCPVGAHTHNVPLSATEKGLIDTMAELEYLTVEDRRADPHAQDAARGGGVRTARRHPRATRRGVGPR